MYKLFIKFLIEAIEKANKIIATSGAGAATRNDILSGESYWQAVTSNFVKYLVTGTGESIGSVATIAVTFYAPPFAKPFVLLEGVTLDQSEQFGTSTQGGFDALKTYDSNNDNIINSSDTQFSSLKVWQDAKKIKFAA